MSRLKLFFYLITYINLLLLFILILGFYYYTYITLYIFCIYNYYKWLKKNKDQLSGGGEEPHPLNYTLHHSMKLYNNTQYASYYVGT